LDVGVVINASVVKTNVSGIVYELIKLWATEQANHTEVTTIIGQKETVVTTGDGDRVGEN
jgi:hypothetical protein